MWAPADSCRKGTRRILCSSSAASRGSISGDGRPKTKRTPSFARQRASSAPPFSSAIEHLLRRLGTFLSDTRRVLRAAHALADIRLVCREVPADHRQVEAPEDRLLRLVLEQELEGTPHEILARDAVPGQTPGVRGIDGDRVHGPLSCLTDRD